MPTEREAVHGTDAHLIDAPSLTEAIYNTLRGWETHVSDAVECVADFALLALTFIGKPTIEETNEEMERARGLAVKMMEECGWNVRISIHAAVLILKVMANFIRRRETDQGLRKGS